MGGRIVLVTPDNPQGPGLSEPESGLSRHCVLELLPRGCRADRFKSDSITYGLCDMTSQGLQFPE